MNNIPNNTNDNIQKDLQIEVLPHDFTNGLKIISLPTKKITSSSLGAKLYKLFGGKRTDFASKEISSELQDRVDRAVQDATSFIKETYGEDAHHITVNFSRLYISYINCNGQLCIVNNKNLSEKFVALMEDVRDLSKEILRVRYAVDPAIDANRPLGSPESLVKTTPAWDQDHKKKASDFLKEDGTELIASLEGNDKLNKGDGNGPMLSETAACKIATADHFLTTLQAKLQKQRDQLNDDLTKLSLPDRRAEIQRKRQQIKQLEKLLNELNQVDRKALFWSIAHAPNGQLSGLSEREQWTVSEAASDSLRAHLNHKLEGSSGHLWWKHAKPRSEDVRDYLADYRTLFFHKLADYYKSHVDENEGMRSKKSSMTEAILDQLLKLQMPKEAFWRADNALSSFALPIDDKELREIVTTAIEETRTETLDKYGEFSLATQDSTANNKFLNFQEQIKALYPKSSKEDPNNSFANRLRS